MLFFATNPFELFISFGNRIRATCPAAQTFLLQLCDGTGGYLPTELAVRGGHYRAYVTSGQTGPDGGDLLVDKTLDILHKMWND
ncbi:MAG: hypothetical protein IJY69_01995 [Clostridia bacterium]|nr:hypothetical protein [Clostridia bacterium]